VPPLPEQEQIVSIFESVHVAEESATEQLNVIAMLKAGLMKNFFSGLVWRNRNL
jgi:restriction endonuclease S subunit